MKWNGIDSKLLNIRKSVRCRKSPIKSLRGSCPNQITNWSQYWSSCVKLLQYPFIKHCLIECPTDIPDYRNWNLLDDLSVIVGNSRKPIKFVLSFLHGIGLYNGIWYKFTANCSISPLVTVAKILNKNWKYTLSLIVEVKNPLKMLFKF